MEEIFVPSSTNLNDLEIEREEHNRALNFRAARIRRSQSEYGDLFRRLNIIVEQLREKYSENLQVDDDRASNGTEDPSSGASSSSEIQHFSRGQCIKRKYSSIEDSSDYVESDAEEHHSELSQEYPKRLENSEPAAIMIGPNGTIVDAKEYDEVSWISAAVATRCLLMLIFTSDTLATHTLTGKPSPAFYGRERPPKMQLDPLKTADIIYCVRSKFGRSEREVRSAITTKCADTAKKYKRRMMKRLRQ